MLTNYFKASLLLPLFMYGQVKSIKKDSLFVAEKTHQIQLSDIDFQETMTDQNNVAGVFQNDYDAFNSAVRFRWGQAWLRPKGFDSRENLVMIDGVVMNSHWNGRPHWNHWGGLNDVINYPTSSNGAEPMAWHSGFLGKSVHFTTNPFEKRSGTKISLMSANHQYAMRLMATNTSRIHRKWQFTTSASYRGGRGKMEGVPYQGQSFFASIGYQSDKNHLFYLTFFRSFNKRDRISPMTQEVFDIKGAYYNPNWGLQNGKKRSGNNRTTNHHYYALTHRFKAQNHLSIKSTLNFQKGTEHTQRIGWQNAPSASPIYYQELPSYALRKGTDIYALAKAYLKRAQLKKDGQIDWDDLADTNKRNQYAHYHVYSDQQQYQQYYLTQKVTWQRLPFSLDIGYHFRHATVRKNALLEDTLQGGYLNNIDPYQKGTARYYDLDKPNQKIRQGGHFKYDYSLKNHQLLGFARIEFKGKKWEFLTGLSVGRHFRQRVGHYKNGRYPKNSKGTSPMRSLDEYHVKTSLLWKINNRHLLLFNNAYLNQPPKDADLYIDVNYQYRINPHFSKERKFLSSLQYRYRGHHLKGKLTGFYHFQKGLSNARGFYGRNLKGHFNGLMTAQLSNMEQRGIGIEASMEWSPNDLWSFDFVATLGDYRHTNNPDLYLYGTDLSNPHQGKTLIKGNAIAAAPQTGLSLGIRYRDPKYWFIATDFNFIDGRYLGAAPITRNPIFLTDSDDSPVLDSSTGQKVKQQDWNALTAQQKLPSVFLVNLTAGKSLMWNEWRFSLFLSVQNVLGNIFKTGGFEQQTLTNYQDLKQDRERAPPVFAPKYWWNRGTVYFLIFKIQF